MSNICTWKSLLNIFNSLSMLYMFGLNSLKGTYPTISFELENFRNLVKGIIVFIHYFLKELNLHIPAIFDIISVL